MQHVETSVASIASNSNIQLQGLWLITRAQNDVFTMCPPPHRDTTFRNSPYQGSPHKALNFTIGHTHRDTTFIFNRSKIEKTQLLMLKIFS